MQDCYVNNNINLAQIRPKIMEKTISPPKNIHVQNHAPITPADCHVKIEYFVHVSWWHINYISYIHNWVTYITYSHSPLWHNYCRIAWILRLLYITTWQRIYVTCIWKLHSWQFILLHTYLGFLYHKSTHHSYISIALCHVAWPMQLLCT